MDDNPFWVSELLDVFSSFDEEYLTDNYIDIPPTKEARKDI